MSANAQMKLGLCEAVGQLYTRDLSATCVLVEHASLLVPRRASRRRVQFDPTEAYAERAALFKYGMHCIGIWHTHPERYPSPSGEDRLLARDYALTARHALAGIVFVIVGTLPPPNAFSVWFNNGNELCPVVRYHAPSPSCVQASSRLEQHATKSRPKPVIDISARPLPLGTHQRLRRYWFYQSCIGMLTAAETAQLSPARSSKWSLRLPAADGS